MGRIIFLLPIALRTMMFPFPFPVAGGRADAGEQLVSSAVSTAIRALLSRVEDLQVSVHCQPVSKLLQGALDGFSLRGRGLVIKNSFRAEILRVDTDAIAIDLGAILGGRVRLLRPTVAVTSVVLREEDINAAFEAPLVVSKMRGIAVEGGGQTLAFEKTRIQLGEDNRVHFETDILLEQSGERLHTGLQARLTVEEQRRIVLADVLFEDDDPRSREWAALFVAHFNRLMDIDKFNLDGATLRIQRLYTRNRQLTFEGRANINHFPGTKGR